MASSRRMGGCLLECSVPSFSFHCNSLVSLADGLAAFRAFLKTEFSEENLEFWLACEDFKKTRSAAKLASKAQRIFEEFIDVQAPREVGRPAPRAGRASLWHGERGALPSFLPCFLPSFPAGGDGQNASCYGNAILPAPVASACSDSSPGEGNYFDDTKLVIASEFTGNCNPHFRTSTSFLGVLHIEPLIYYQSPNRLLGSFLPGHFV